jgi:hypothetical protein
VKKNGLLLIEIFRKTKLWPPGIDPWWPFLYVRASNKHLKHANSDHQNNARGHLVNISSLPLNVISPINPFLKLRVSKNFVFRLISQPPNNAGGLIRIPSPLTSAPYQL